MSTVVYDLVQRIIHTPDNREVLFTELDEMLWDASNDEINETIELLQPNHELLLRIRAEYEHNREMELARQIITTQDYWTPVRSFRSTNWYNKAHEFENSILNACKRILLVGSGPFPTSAFSFMSNLGATVTGVERDKEACIVSRQIANIARRDFEIINQDALEITDFSNYDCVVVGCVVGISEAEKKAIVHHYTTHVPRNVTLVFRTAIGPGRLIYPTVHALWLDGISRQFTAPPQRTFTMIMSLTAHGKASS